MRFLRRAAAGAEAGVLAGAGVAVFFLVGDAVQLHLFSTPLALASQLFGPLAADPAGSTLDRVLAFSTLGVRLFEFTALHFLTFVAVGAVAAFVLDVGSFWRSLWGGVAYACVVCTGLLYASGWVVDSPVAVRALGLPSVLLANAMAGAIIGVGLHLVRSEIELEEEA